MKKLLLFVCCLSLLLTSACGLRLEKVEPPTVVDGPGQVPSQPQQPAAPSEPDQPDPAPQQPDPAPPAPMDLTGSWKQVDGNDPANYQFAMIEDGAISVYWAFDDGTTALYWAGSYAQPAASGDSYTWTSDNDTNRTGAAILASTADSKVFSYKDGRIHYEVSAMGASTTVQLEPFDGELPPLPAAPAPSAGRQETEGTLGQFYVKVTGFRLTKDYDGKDVLVLQYDFTNNSGEDASAMWSLAFTAFQDGVQIDTAWADDVSDNRDKTIKPGITLSCEEAFLISGKSPVELEITELITFNDEKVVTTFTLAE